MAHVICLKRLIKFSNPQQFVFFTFSQNVTMGSYKTSPPVDCNKSVNLARLNGKTAIVTGGESPNPIRLGKQIANTKAGANGIGEAYVRALSAAE